MLAAHPLTKLCRRAPLSAARRSCPNVPPSAPSTTRRNRPPGRPHHAAQHDDPPPQGGDLGLNDLVHHDRRRARTPNAPWCFPGGPTASGGEYGPPPPDRRPAAPPVVDRRRAVAAGSSRSGTAAAARVTAPRRARHRRQQAAPDQGPGLQSLLKALARGGNKPRRRRLPLSPAHAPAFRAVCPMPASSRRCLGVGLGVDDEASRKYAAKSSI